MIQKIFNLVCISIFAASAVRQYQIITAKLPPEYYFNEAVKAEVKYLMRTTFVALFIAGSVVVTGLVLTFNS